MEKKVATEAKPLKSWKDGAIIGSVRRHSKGI